VTVLPDAAAPTIVSVTPTADQNAVALDSTVQIQFSDAIDPSTVNTSTFSISGGGSLLPASVNYDPSSYAVIITPAGIFSAGTQYTVAVSNLVADPAGMTLTSESQWTFTTQSGISTNGNVSTSLVADPTSLTVVSYGGTESTPDSQGNFTATIAPLGTSLVASIIPGENFGWLAFAGNLSQGTNADTAKAVRNMLAAKADASAQRKVFVTHYQITSSPEASGSPSGIVVDSTTTAESLLFMTPYFFNPDPTQAATVQAVIATDPNVPALAQALEAAQNEADPINDATVQADLQQAALSILNTLINDAGSTTSALRRGPAAEVATTEHATAVHPRPMTSPSPGSLVPLITPNCYIESPGTLNGMQCLDLQYIELSVPISTDAQGNFDVTVNNCWFMQASGLDTGCITSWLVEVAPMTAVPSSGVSSIDAAVGEGGQSASPITDFDPGCTLGAPSQGCSFLWVSGTSALTDSGYGISTLIEQALQLSQYAPESGGTGPASFPLPGGVAQNYIVRAYSGGFADLTEYGNILQGYYNTDSGTLVANAFVMNAFQASLSFVGALYPAPSAQAKTALASCVIQDAINNRDFFNQASVFQTALANDGQLTASEMQTLFEDQFNTFVGIAGKYETTCAASLAIDAAKTAYSNLSFEAHLFLNNPKSALGGLLDSAIQAAVNEAGGSEVSGLGEGTQRVVELIGSATPIETAIVSVTTLNQSPQVTGVLPNPLVATGSLQPVTIQGVGFQPGAEINWKNVGTGVSTTTIPSSVTPSSVAASMNFTSQAANWEVQIVDNPANLSTTSSNWWPFSVLAGSGSKPDLIPLGVTLNSGSVAAGNTVTVSFTVENQGTGSAAASMTGFRLGTSSSVPPGPSGDIPNSSISTQALAAGQSVQQSQTLTIPSATTAGTFYIWVVVDDVVNSTLGQSNTANDYASSPALTVTAGQTPVPAPTSPGTLTDTGFLVTTTTPTMQWSGSGATTYELAISSTPYGSGNVVYDNSAVAGSVASFQIPSGYLNSSVKYAWNMRATNAAGTSSWSAPLYFTVNTATVPPTPTGLSPGATTSPGPSVTTLTPTLSWSPSTGASAYSVAVSQLNGGVVCAQNVTTNSATCPAFQNGSTYFWTVSASNSAGSSTTAAIMYFTVNSAAVPPTPAGLSPGSTSSPGPTVTTLTPTLGWNASSGATAYSVAVSQLNGGAVCAQNVTTNSATCPALQNGSTYFWTVSASNSAGSSATAAIVYFTVNTEAVPPTPTGLSPGSTSSPGPTVTTLTPTLTWNASTGATAYSVGVSQLNGGLVYSANVTANSAPIPTGKLTSGATYFWTVSASNSAGSSATAAIVYFTVNTATVPPTPTGLSPGTTSSPGPTVTTLTPTLSWNTSTGATAYSVAVSQLNGGVVCSQNVATNSASCPAFQNGSTYFWTVSASNSAGSSATATIVYFTVNTATVPPTPTGLSPGSTSSPGPTVTTLTPTLSWNALTGAAAYSVAVSQLNGGVVYAANVTTNSAPIPTGKLTSGATYFWTVSASNSAGSSATATIVYFTVNTATVPPTPTGLSPGSTSSPGPTVTTLTPTLTWNASTGATAYSVAVSQLNGGVVCSENVTTNSATCPALQNGATYFWAVSASNSAGSSATSSVVYFTVSVATVPAAPTLDAPGSSTSPGPTLTNLTPTFVWFASAGATKYMLYVRDLTTNVLVYDNESIGNTTSIVMPSGTLVAGHSYRWDMQASNGAGTSGYSTYLFFQE
jgi:hypothetical protein